MIGLESRALPTMPPQYYLLAALAFSLLVIIHELGHFLVARAFGMRARVFSIGFGPPIAQWRPKGSETLVQVAAVPILAYVNIAGMNPLEPSDPNDRGSYQNASLLARFFTIRASGIVVYGSSRASVPPSFWMSSVASSSATSSMSSTVTMPISFRFSSTTGSATRSNFLNSSSARSRSSVGDSIV